MPTQTKSFVFHLEEFVRPGGFVTTRLSVIDNTMDLDRVAFGRGARVHEISETIEERSQAIVDYIESRFIPAIGKLVWDALKEGRKLPPPDIAFRRDPNPSVSDAVYNNVPDGPLSNAVWDVKKAEGVDLSDDPFNEPLGEACRLDDETCESCQ